MQKNGGLLVTITGSPDEAILRKEIEQFMAYEPGIKNLILRSAHKLSESGKFDDDKTVICARICKIFPMWSSRWIRECLPLEYKRVYRKKDEIPLDEVEQALKGLADMFTDLGRELKKMAKKMKKNREYKQLFINQFGGTGELKRISDELAMEASLCKSLNDGRERIDILTKVLVKEALEYYNSSHVANMAGISNKWLKSKNFNKDNIVDRAAAYLEKFGTHFFGLEFRIMTWVREQESRHKKSLPVIFPELGIQ